MAARTRHELRRSRCTISGKRTNLLDLIRDLLERLSILGSELSGLDETLLVERSICARG